MRQNLSKVLISILIIINLLLGCTSNNFSAEKQAVLDNIAGEYYQIAEEYVKLKKYPKAIEYYLKIENITDYTNSVRYKLARCYAMNSDWDNATKMYNLLLESDSENISLLCSLAYVYAKNAKFENASLIYEKLILKNEYDPNILKNYILVEIAAENTEKVERLKTLFREKFPLDDSINKLAEDAQKIVDDIKKKQADEKAKKEAGKNKKNKKNETNETNESNEKVQNTNLELNKSTENTEQENFEKEIEETYYYDEENTSSKHSDDAGET
ncbi:MAG: hypothetical protein GX220_07130 [Treponema sp.]|nr:hypothetical protein [Treponema sp.]